LRRKLSRDLLDYVNVPRSRRYIKAKRPYELILRVKSGLPFPALLLVNFLIKCALARTQRDMKVILCHILWMGNHAHILFVSLDTQACVNFSQELQKKVTEMFKRLTGKHRLSLWEGDAVLAEVLDVEAAVSRIAYIYSNPARAGLVESISDYPGVSSWEAFSHCAPSTLEVVREEVLCPRLPMIEKLPSFTLTDAQDQHITQKLHAKCKRAHLLELYPNAWMESFGITDREEIASRNKQIREGIRENEADARKKRTKPVLGSHRLKRQIIFKEHTPKRRERRVYFYSSLMELRISFLEAFRRFSERCTECYRRWMEGDLQVEWPPGAFRPMMGPLAVVIE